MLTFSPLFFLKEELHVFATNALQVCEELVFVSFPVTLAPQHVCVCTSGGKVEVNISADHSHQVRGAEDHGVSNFLPPWRS